MIGLAFASFLTAFSGAVMPGAMLASVIASTRRYGKWAGPLTVAGHGILEVVIIALLLLGLSPFLTNPVFLLVLGLVGGGLLVWSGIDTFRRTPRLSTEANASAAKPDPHPVLAGIVSSISNPYFLLWWAGIGLSTLTTFLDGVSNRWLGAFVFFVAHILGDLVWYSLVSFLLAGGRRLISEKAYGIVVRVAAGAVVALGLYYIFSAVRIIVGVI